MPPQRMTASRNLLLKSKVACTLFLNESKRDALQNFLNNQVLIKQCPIKLVNSIPKHFEFTDILEEKAA
jgi:6-phosphogluconolactonase